MKAETCLLNLCHLFDLLTKYQRLNSRQLYNNSLNYSFF